MKYDYLIIGAGLAGSIFAYEANKKGKKVLVVDKRNHIGGNCFTEKIEDINVHMYGPHIFHTNNKKIWDYISQFTEFNNYINCPKAIFKDKIYSLPFNMNTFYEIFGVKTPKEVKNILDKRPILDKLPDNLAEQAINLIGTEIFQILIEGYTEKQWGKPCTELPPDIIKRLPVRFTYNNNYFNDRYQGIPINGYTQIFEKLLKGIEIKLNTEFVPNKFDSEKIIFTGPIDEYFNYKFGKLEFRTLRFESEILNIDNYQGNAVINYTDKNIPYTRIIEHKHFEFGEQPKTVITKEYSEEGNTGEIVYYPINTEKNNNLLKKYQEESEKLSNVIFAGRQGLWRYMDMDKVIENTLEICEKELK
jgi:UDP-galactopyranose mutase